MTNLTIELLFLILVLVNFGPILTANIYLQSLKEIQRKGQYEFLIDLLQNNLLR